MHNSLRTVMVAFGLVFGVAGGIECQAARKFTVLGNQTISVPTDEHDNPWMAESREFRVDAVGLKIAAREGGQYGINAMFGIILKKPVTVTRILVEDITGPSSVIVGRDENPVFNQKLWKATSPAVEITKDSPSWIYQSGDSWLIYRITLSTKERGDIVLLQPACFDWMAKSQIQVRAGVGEFKKYQDKMSRLLRSGKAVLAGRKSLIIIPVSIKPSPGAVKDMVEALKQAKKQQLAVAVASEELDWIMQLVEQALAKAKPEQHAGVTLAVAAPKSDTVSWATLTKDTGLTIITGELTD